MKNFVIKTLTPAAVALMVFAGVGCDAHKPVSRMSTSSTNGRELTAEIDGRASFKKQGDDHIIAFGGHELVVKKEWVVVDGDRGRFGIPTTARKVEIKVRRGILTLSADGSNLIKTPI